MIYREGEAQRPTFHGSFIELHWPKFGAVAASLLALGYYVTSGRSDLTSMALAALLIGAGTYFVLNGVRKKLNDVHTARTELFRSRTFAVGAMIGMAYFAYTLLAVNTMSTGSDIGDAVARIQDPLGPFRDGFQREDWPWVGSLGLKAIGYMVACGMAVRWLAKRFLGIEA